MTRLARPAVVIGAAAMLTVLVVLGLQLLFAAQGQRAAAQEAMLGRAERIMSGADGTLLRTLGALDALASNQAIEEQDWEGLYRRLRDLQRADPGWVTVRVTDLAQRRILFDLRRSYGAAAGPEGFAIPAAPGEAGDAFAGGIGGSGPGCPCALAHRFIYRDGAPAQLLTVALDPQLFLPLLERETPRAAVGAIVDRDGRFVARSLDHSQRLGALATQVTRDAIRASPSGIYSGRTWEGFDNYSAFTTSSLSGWSAYVAFAPGMLDSPRWRAAAAAGLVIAAALLLAMTVAGFALLRLREARRTEQRLQQAQKMETLGLFTGGIAHDFNNLMTPILGGLDMLSRTARIDPQARPLLDGAIGAARKAAKLTGQLLTFSRRRAPEMVPVDLAALLDQAIPLFAQSAGAGVKIESRIEPGAGWVLCDPDQLELALLNLVLNGRDAMPNGGTVTITAHPVPADRGLDMVAIDLADSGRGMSADELACATEPFFTTKPPGRGTGLGLAQVSALAEQSGGTFEIASTPGRGTRVTLKLPACDPQPAVERSAPVAAGSGRALEIVLCDDDEAVRDFMLRALDEARHATEAVSDGRAAVELVRRAPPDLLIVDLAMHGMDGVDVVREVRSFLPQLPIVLITGHVETERLAEVEREVTLLRKPFDAAALLAAVDRAAATVSP